MNKLLSVWIIPAKFRKLTFNSFATMAELKKIACDRIDALAGPLNDISQLIWCTPELTYEEFEAHDNLTKFLEDHGFPDVDRNYLLPTAFRAQTQFGEGKGPHLAVLCEYDALPGIGHGCGHNLIAEVGVATSLGIKAALDTAVSQGTINAGTLSVLGTPAEEGPGGKIDLIKAGAFQGFNVAMMAHPSRASISRPRYLAQQNATVTFHGKPSHASSFPWHGVNALDAAVTAYQSVSNLRQQMKPTWRVHGIISKGGLKANIIPDLTEMEFMIRAPDQPDLKILKEKVFHCFKSAADATGCSVDIQFSSKPYMDLLSNNTMSSLFEENAQSLGMEISTDDAIIKAYGGSTDMGNVSHVIPSIHPKFYMGTDSPNHTKEFTVASGDPKAQSYTLTTAKALAMAAIDVYIRPELLGQINSDFEQDLKALVL